jgi:hypothetical protein
MFAKPAQSGGVWFWSLIVMLAGNKFVVVRTEIGQSLNTRV